MVFTPDSRGEMATGKPMAGVRRLDLNQTSHEDDVTMFVTPGDRRAIRDSGVGEGRHHTRSAETLERDATARPGTAADEDGLAYTNWQLDIAERLIRQQQLEIRRLKDRFVPPQLRPRTDIVHHSDVILSEESVDRDLYCAETTADDAWTFARVDVSNDCNNLFVEPRLQRVHDDMDDIILSISDTDLSTLSLR